MTLDSGGRPGYSGVGRGAPAVSAALSSKGSRAFNLGGLMIKVLVAALLAVGVASFATLHYQQVAIRALIAGQVDDEARFQALTIEIEQLRLELLFHEKREKELGHKLEFLQQQSDLLVAAKRSGRNG